MTCKDCIHYKVCCQKHLHVVTGMDFVYRYKYNHIEQECKNFKDRSRFVELPCELGDTVYYFNSAGKIFSQKVSGFIVNFVGILVDSDVMFDSHLMGDRFFSTREEAEQALKLKERENEGQRRLLFTMGKSNVAVFNWSKIVGLIKL